MKILIPNMVSPLPDELLYSWVLILAKINGLSPELFFKTYFGEDVFGKKSIVPIEIRRSFREFYNNLDIDIPASDLYLKLSTMQFESLAYPEKMQTRLINNVFRKESILNNIKVYFFNKFNMCPECMKEDIETYGEVYIHRSHQLTGVKVCHKHHTPLMIETPKKDFNYNYEDMVAMVLSKSLQEECNYADYVHQLLEGNIQSNSNALMTLVFKGFGIDTKSKKDVIIEINKVLGNSNFSNVWAKNDDIVPIEDLMKLLMYLYPNPQDVIKQVEGYNLIVSKYCEKCNQYYYTTNQGLKDGWGCIYCDEKLGEEELLKRLIKVIGNNEYTFKSFSKGKGGRLSLYHKYCGQDISLLLGNFIFRHTKCNCNQKLQRQEAEKKMKAFPEFKLVEFGGSSMPAKFYHNNCNKHFVVSFREFLRTPKCRCCEIQQDITPTVFRQKVKDIVGDEYEVLGDVYRLDDKVEIKHVNCGTIHEYKALQFLFGSRCPKCYIKMSIKKTNMMLEDYSNGRYKVIGQNKYFLILWDNKENKEIQLSGKHIAQELLRPTPSSILDIDMSKKNKTQITTWDSWYRLCLDYKEEFGHLYIKRNEKYRDLAIYDWVGQQRTQYNRGLLSNEKVQKLKEIGFIFDTVLYNWNIRFEEYKQYVADTGDISPKRNVIYNGKQVGNWVRTQKQQEERGKLQPRFKEILLDFNPSFFDSKLNKKA